MKNLTPNQAAAQALQLFSQEARLCDRHPSKVARTHNRSALPDEEERTESLPGAPPRPAIQLHTKDSCSTPDIDNSRDFKTDNNLSKTSKGLFLLTYRKGTKCAYSFKREII